MHEIMSPPNIENVQIPKTTSTYKIYQQNKDNLEALEDSGNEYGFKHNSKWSRYMGWFPFIMYRELASSRTVKVKFPSTVSAMYLIESKSSFPCDSRS